MKRRLRALLVHPRLPLLAALLAVVLTSPSLFTGLRTDDILQRRLLLGEEGGGGGFFGDQSRLEMFSFCRDRERLREYLESGLLPWWSDPEVRLAFLRPLSALTHIADYELWPDSPFLMHAHGLAWYGLLALLVARLHRRLLSPDLAGGFLPGATPVPRAAWTAGLAGLLYALDDAHAMPAGWIANRNAMISGAFGVAAILAHVRWRTLARDARGRDAILPAVAAPTLLALGLLAGESAVSATAYLFAYAVFLDGFPPAARDGSDAARRASLPRRLATLIPAAAVVVAWRAVYSGLGFGAYASEFYIDPAREPIRFLGAVLERAPLLMQGQWGAFPTEGFTGFSLEARRTAILLCTAFAGIVLAALAPLVRRDRVARLHLCGMLLSLLPLCATMPMDRLLFFAGIGGSGLLALWIERRRLLPPTSPFARRAGGALLGAMIAIHLLLAPLVSPLRSMTMYFSSGMLEPARRVETPPEIAGQDLIVVGSPGEFMLVQPILVFALHEGRPTPRHVRTLFSGRQSATLEGIDDHAIRVRLGIGQCSPGGLPDRTESRAPAVHPFHVTHALDRIFRADARPLRPGDVVEVPGMRVEVLETTPEGWPVRMEYRFDRPLADPSHRWIAWRAGDYAPFAPPRPGEVVELPIPSPK